MTALSLPDITSHLQAHMPQTLQWVGMEQIAVPFYMQGNNAATYPVTASADLFVSLNNPQAKGIHMSRLHHLLNQQLAHKALTQQTVSDLLEQMIDSQQHNSHSARVRLTFDLVLERPALLSPLSGFQAYPVTLDYQRHPKQNTNRLSLTIPYSSTCPCSASLSRQLYSHAIADQFPEDTIDKHALLAWVNSEQGTVATPHSQRSYAYLELTFNDTEMPDIPALITQLEKAIGTPVQTAVKREDEQAFAKLNADNLLFCEDAARRIKAALETIPALSDYWFKVEHQESLHAHNAVVIDQKFPPSHS